MPWASTFHVAFWALAMLVSLTVFYFGLVMGGIVPWLALPLTISGIVAALFCAWRLWLAVRARRVDLPVVIIDGDGFLDTRMGARIPWSEIHSLTRDQPGTRTFLRIAARDPARFAKRRRAVRDGVLVSSLSELDMTADRLIDAAMAHKATA